MFAFTPALFFLFTCLADADQTTFRALPVERISALQPSTLKLIGHGTFRYLGMKLYDATFYLDAKVSDTRRALEDVPKRLVIHYLRDIPRNALIQAAEKNIRNNRSVDFDALKDRVHQLHEKYVDLKKGDTYALVYSGGYTYLYYNNNLKTRIAGSDFARAYFGIWISEYSINQKFRNILLGIRKG